MARKNEIHKESYFITTPWHYGKCFIFDQKYQFLPQIENLNETWKAELRELKKVSVKDKITALSSKVEEKPAKKIGSLSQSKWRSSSLRKAGY